MKKIIFILSIVLGLSTNAQIQSMAGPRIGMTIIAPGETADILNQNDGKSAFTTQYGWQWESRFVSGTEFVGLVEWVIVAGGMEKGKVLPSISSIVGFRNAEGFEMGMGPNLSIGGIGMVFGMGMNFKSGELNLPVNIVIVPPKNDSGFAISFMIGFNMSK
jgi:opacity protein-like surface antigen